MPGDPSSSTTHAIGGSNVLSEIAVAFRDERESILTQWLEVLRDAEEPSIPTGKIAAEQMETLLDRYLDALETGSPGHLERDARTLETQNKLFPFGDTTLLSALFSLRDILARSLSQRLQRSPARLLGALDAFEPAANRIAEAVAIGIYDEHARVIRRQQDAIRALSTPVLQVRAGVLLHPIIGTLDIHRARQLTADLLASVRRKRARAVVMDLTGVPVVDVAVATQLIHTVEAVRLLGATLIISGISADTARALAETGLTLSGLQAVGDLEDGLLEADDLVEPLRQSLRVSAASTDA